MSGRVSLVIPARNEAATLPGVLDELPWDLLHEVIVVEGGSTDDTFEVAKRYNHPKLMAVKQSGKGFGQANIQGIHMASGEFITVFDGDGSFDPQGLGLMLDKMDGGYDFVFCSRYLPEAGSDDDTAIRLLGNRIFTSLLRTMFGVRLSDALFYYCMGRREIYGKLPLISQDFSLCVEVPIRVHRMGCRYAELPLRERPRLAGASKVNAARDGALILAAMLRFLREIR